MIGSNQRGEQMVMQGKLAVTARLISFAAFLLLAVTWIFPEKIAGQDAIPNLPSGAQKYYQILQKRPQPGVVFNRFVEAWLNEQDAESLEKFLLHQQGSSDFTIGNELLLGHFLSSRGKQRRALEVFSQLVEKEPKSVEARFWKARTAAGLDDYKQALFDADYLLSTEGLEIDQKRRIEILKLKGRWQVRLGKSDEALATWKVLLEKFANTEIFEDVLDLQIREGMLDEATQTAAALIEKTKTDIHRQAVTRLRLADVRDLAGDRPGAIQSLEIALKQSGGGSWLETEIIARLESLFRQEDDINTLKDQILKWRDLFPEKIALHRLHAQLLAETGNPGAAIEAFQKIIKMTPGDRITREQFIDFSDKLGDRKKAIAHLEQLMASHPDDAELQIRMAALLHAEGKVDSVIVSIQEYLKISEGGEYEHLRAAQLMERYGAGEAAESIYQKMIKLFPASVDGKESLASFLHRTERQDEANALWLEIAASGDGDTALRIAQIMAARNEHASAYSLLQSRAKEMQGDPVYLARLCSEALKLDKEKEVVDSARQLVALANNAAAMGSALELAGKVIEGAGVAASIAQELAAKQGKLSIQDTCLLAELLDRTGRLSEAEKLLTAVSEDDQSLALEQKIRLLTGHRFWAEAATAAETALNLPGGRRIENVLRLVIFNQRAGQDKEALAWLESWKQLAPGSISPWLREADILLNQGEEDAATALLERAMRKFPDDPGIRERLANVYVSLGKGSKAEYEFLNLYEKTEIESSKLRWAGRLAEVAMSLGRLDRVVELFETRRRSNPKSAGPLLALAAAYRQTDDYERVRRYLSAAVHLRPSDVRLRLQLAAAEERAGDWKAARRTLDIARKMDRTDAATQKLAQLLINHGEEEAGMLLLKRRKLATAGKKRSSSVLPIPVKTDPVSLEKMADSLAAASDWPLIISLLTPLLEKYSEDYRLRYIYALALEENGELDAAGAEFLRVMDIQKELPKARCPIDPIEVKLYGKDEVMPSGHRLLLDPDLPFPPGVTELEWQRQASIHAYRHWSINQTGLATVMDNTLNLSGAIRLPHSLDEASAFSVFHLRRIAQTQRAKNLEKWQEKMESRGITQAKILLTNPVILRAWGSQPHFPITEETEKSEVLLAEWLLHEASFHTEPTGGLKRLQTAYDLFLDNYPELALGAALNALSITDKSQRSEAKDFFQEGVKASLSKIEKPGEIVLSELVPLYHILAGAKFKDWQQESSETFDLIGRKIKAWHKNVSPRDAIYPRLFALYAKELWRRGDQAKLVAMLDKEIKDFRSKAGNQTPPSIWKQTDYWKMAVPTLSRFDFPPASLPHLPQRVFSLFDPSGAERFGINVNGPISVSIGEDLSDPEKEKFVEQISDKSLRIIVSAWLGDSEFVEAEMKRIEANLKAVSLDERLLLASFFSKKNQSDKTLKVFEGLRPDLSGDWRRRVDSAIIALAVGNVNQSPGLMTAAQLSSDRLVRGGLTPHAKEELGAAIGYLGFSKKAAQLSQSGVRNQYQPPFPIGKGIRKRIEQLQQRENWEDAAQLALVHMSRYTDAYYSRISFDYQRDPIAAKFSELLNEISLKGDVLEAVAKEIRESSADWARYAAITNILGDVPTTVQALQKAIALSPNSKEANIMRSHLVFLTAIDHPEIAKNTLKDSPDNPVAFVNVILHRWGRQGNNQQFRWLPFWGMFIEHAASRDDFAGETTGEFGAWKAVLSSIGGQLEQAEPIYGDHLDPNIMMKERRLLYTSLCKSMLAEPSLAQLGFSRLAMLEKRDAGIRGRVKYELSDLARKSLRIAPQSHSLYRYGAFHNRSPGEYLVDAAFAKQEKIDLKAMLSGFELPQSEIKYLEAYSDLYYCEPGEFLEAAKRFSDLDVWALESNKEVATFRIISAWRTRRIKSDIDSFVNLGNWEPLYYSDSNRNIRSYLEGLVERGESDIAGAFFEALAVKMIGPKEDQVQIISRVNNANRMPGNKVQNFTSFIDNLGKSPLLMPETLRFNSRFGSRASAPQMRALWQSIKSDSGISNPDTIITWLENPYFMTDVTHFDPLTILSSKRNQTLFGKIINFLNLCKLEKREKVVNYLHERKASSFGSDLLIAYTSGLNLEKNVAALVAKNAEAILAMPKDRQQALGALFDETTLGFSGQSGNKAGWNLITDLRKMGVPVSSLIAKVNAAKTFSELGMNGSSFQRDLVNDLRSVIAQNPRLASDTFIKASELVTAAVKNGDRQIGVSNSADFTRQMWRELARPQKPNLGIFPFMLDVTSHEVLGREIPFTQYELRYAGRSFKSIMEKHQNGGRGKSQAFQLTFNDLGKVCGDRPVELTSSMMFYFYRSVKGWEYNSVIDFLKREQKSGTYPKLSEAIAMGMDLNHNIYQWNGNNKLPVGRSYTATRRWFVDQLRNENLPLRWRILMATDSVGNNYEILVPPEGAWAAADILISCLKENIHVGNAEFSSIALAFSRTAKRDGWAEKSEKIIASWTRLTRRNSRASSGGNQTFAPDTNCLLAMLELTLQAKDSAATERLLLNHAKSLNTEPGAIFVLARYGRPEIAGSFLKLNWRKLNSRHRNIWHDGIPLSEADRNKLVTGAGSPGIALLAEVIVAGAADDKKAGESQLIPISPNHDERMAAFAKRFQETAFDSKELRLLTLEWIVGSSIPASSKLLAEIAEEADGKIDPVAIIASNGSTSSRRKMWLAFGHIAGATAQGDIKPFGHYLGAINKSKHGNTRWWVHYEAFKAFQRSLPRSWPNDPEGISRQMIPILQKYLESDDLYNKWDNSLSVGLLLVAHVWIDDMKSFDLWWQRLPASKQDKLLAESRQVRKCGLALKLLLNREKNESIGINKRIEIIEKVQATKVFQHAYQVSPNWFRYILSNGILSPQELIEHGEPWMESFPRDGRAVFEFSVILSKNGQLERGLALLESELERIRTESPKDLRQWEPRMILGKSEALLEAQKFDLARAALEDFPENTIFAFQNMRNLLLRKIEEKSEAAKKP